MQNNAANIGHFGIKNDLTAIIMSKERRKKAILFLTLEFHSTNMKTVKIVNM